MRENVIYGDIGPRKMHKKRIEANVVLNCTEEQIVSLNAKNRYTLFSLLAQLDCNSLSLSRGKTTAITNDISKNNALQMLQTINISNDLETYFKLYFHNTRAFTSLCCSSVKCVFAVFGAYRYTQSEAKVLAYCHYVICFYEC